MNPLRPIALATVLLLAACASTPVDLARIPLAGAVSPAPGIVSAGRVAAGDIAALRAAGIRQVIDLTPDAETPGFDEASAVRGAGMAYSNLPLGGGTDLTRANVQAFDTLLRRADHPVLVHCASGNRVGAMAALRAAWIEGKPAEEAIAIGRAWGLKGLEAEVRRRIEAGPGE